MAGAAARAAIASVAVAVIAFSAAADAQGPPQPPTIPDIPDLGEPDDVAKFNLEIVGSQSSSASVTGSQFIDPCNFEFNVVNNEEWEFKRGKGVTIVFERFGRIVLMSRQGHPAGDTTLAVVGSLSRTATGGYNEVGPPPCRGSFPSNQTDCNASFAVKSPMALLFTKQGVVTLDRTASQQLIPLDDSESPARLCGSDDANPDTAWYDYSYPYLVKTDFNLLAGNGLYQRVPKQILFGKRKRLRFLGDASHNRESPGIYTTTTNTSTSVELILRRLGRD